MQLSSLGEAAVMEAMIMVLNKNAYALNEAALDRKRKTAGFSHGFGTFVTSRNAFNAHLFFWSSASALKRIYRA